MAQIILPGTTAVPVTAEDEATYEGLRDLASITATNAEIDANPLFQYAEAFIVEQLPVAALTIPPPDPAGQGRNYEHRTTVLRILQFFAAANFARGGGSVGGETTTQGSGDVKSETETIGPITRTKSYDVGSQTTRQSASGVSHEDRAEWLEAQAIRLFALLGIEVNIVDPDSAVSVSAGLTDSKLPEEPDFALGYYRGIF